MNKGRIAVSVFLSAILISSVAIYFNAKAQSEQYGIKFPLGLDPDVMQIPEDNPMTPEKVELGKMLYFDPRLSANGTVSCASCHDPAMAFTDNLPVSKGMHQQAGTRNAPTVINTAFNYFHFWDGRSPSLEEQAKGPIENPVEMAHTLDGAVDHLKKLKGYEPYFKAAFGSEEINIDRVVKAIAAFERTILSGNSAWDRYVYLKEESAMSDSAKRGLELFEGKARCTQCHVGFNLTDGLFHNLGVGMNQENPDLGRFLATGDENDKGAFKTPGLRDVEKTFPYMHDGSVATLEEVIELYDEGGEPNPWLDPKMQPLNLTEQEKKDLLAFMKSLNGDWEGVKPPKLPK